jgi:hypothetical protein
MAGTLLPAGTAAAPVPAAAGGADAGLFPAVPVTTGTLLAGSFVALIAGEEPHAHAKSIQTALSGRNSRSTPGVSMAVPVPFNSRFCSLELELEC